MKKKKDIISFLVHISLMIFMAAPPFLFSKGVINVFSTIAGFLGMFTLWLAVNNYIGVRQEKKHGCIYLSEILSCKKNEDESDGEDVYNISCLIRDEKGEKEELSFLSDRKERKGSAVSISVNRKTGEIYRVKDIEEWEKNKKFFGIALLVFAVITALSELAGRVILPMFVNDIEMFFLCLMMFVGGIAFILVGYSMAKQEMKYRSMVKNSEQITGTVVEYKKHTHKDEKKRQRTSFCPVIRYIENDEERIYEAEVNTDRSQYPVGSKITIYKNSEGKEEYKRKKNGNMSMAMGFILVGLFMIGYSVFFVVTGV